VDFILRFYKRNVINSCII